MATVLGSRALERLGIGRLQTLGISSAVAAIPLWAQVPLGARYTLTVAETERCIALANERTARNAAEHRRERKYTGTAVSAVDINTQGLVGEWAFAALFGGHADMDNTECRNVLTDLDADCRLPNGWTVDVKTTWFVNADLRVPQWKATNPPAVYALMIVENYGAAEPITAARPPVLVFAGAVAASDVMRPGRLQFLRE